MSSENLIDQLNAIRRTKTESNNLAVLTSYQNMNDHKISLFLLNYIIVEKIL